MNASAALSVCITLHDAHHETFATTSCKLMCDRQESLAVKASLQYLS